MGNHKKKPASRKIVRKYCKDVPCVEILYKLVKLHLERKEYRK